MVKTPFDMTQKEFNRPHFILQNYQKRTTAFSPMISYAFGTNVAKEVLLIQQSTRVTRHQVRRGQLIIIIRRFQDSVAL